MGRMGACLVGCFDFGFLYSTTGGRQAVLIRPPHTRCPPSARVRATWTRGPPGPRDPTRLRAPIRGGISNQANSACPADVERWTPCPANLERPPMTRARELLDVLLLHHVFFHVLFLAFAVLVVHACQRLVEQATWHIEPAERRAGLPRAAFCLGCLVWALDVVGFLMYPWVRLEEARLVPGPVRAGVDDPHRPGTDAHVRQHRRPDAGPGPLPWAWRWAWVAVHLGVASGPGAPARGHSRRQPGHGHRPHLPDLRRPGGRAPLPAVPGAGLPRLPGTWIGG